MYADEKSDVASASDHLPDSGDAYDANLAKGASGVSSHDFLTRVDEIEVQNAGDTLMHNFWHKKFDNFRLEELREFELKQDTNSNNDLKNQFEINKYYMPTYFQWLKKKLPHINIWSNLCLGDLNRYNEGYNYRLPRVLGRSIADANRTDATVEHFFSLKKNNPCKLRLPLGDFIQKCWEDNRGLRRQFINGLEEGIREIQSGEIASRESCSRLKHFITETERGSHIEGDFESDTEEPCSVEEGWDRSDQTNCKNKSTDTGF